MTEEQNKSRYEQNFRDIFAKLNRLVPSTVFITTLVVVIGFWGSIFALMYTDLQDHKRIATIERIEVIRELGEVKILIGKISK